MNDKSENKVTDNTEQSRYELPVDNNVVFAKYRLQGDSVSILHVETPVALRGKGLAGELMKGITQIARERNLKIIPVCPYAIAWMKRSSTK